MTLLTTGALYLSVIMSFFRPPASSLPQCYSCTDVTEHLGSPLTPQPVPSLPTWRWLSYSYQLGLGCLRLYLASWRINPTPLMQHICLLFSRDASPNSSFPPLLTSCAISPWLELQGENKNATTCSEYLKLMKWEDKHVESKSYFFSPEVVQN